MDSNLKIYLAKHNIEYQIYTHKAVFTVEQSSSIKQKIPGKHTKCLFLKDSRNQFYIIAIEANKRLDTKSLKKKLKIKKLNFGSPEELKQQLNLTPGSVSIFGLIYNPSVYLIIDSDLYKAAKVSFHPNINTSTLVLNHDSLEKFLSTLKVKIEIMEL